MKKKIVSIVSIILFICLTCNIIYATETNVTLQKNKEKYTGGDTVEISVKVNDITLEKGIETIIGKISYNKDLYENCVIEESDGWEADYNDDNGKIILQRDEAIKENHTVFVIKLTVKDNIANNDTISFIDINIADENTDLFPQNVTTSINIENVVTDGGEKPEGEQGQNPENNPSETPQDKTLTGIEVEKEPAKNTYKVGEKFDKTGMKIVAKYSDGTTKEITEYTIQNGDKLVEGQTSVKVSYTEGNITKIIEQKITVVKNITVEDDKKDDDKSEFEEIKKDDTKTENKMPDTGVSNIIGIIVIIAAFGVVVLVKYNKYKGI